MHAWLIANAAWLEPLEALVAILVIVWAIIKFFGQQIASGIRALKKRLTGDPAIPRTLVTLVLDPRRTLWSMGARGRNPAMQIMTSWYATNASKVSISLLDAGLIVPNPSGRTCMATVHIIERGNNWARSGIELPIQPGQTETVEAHFFLDPPTEKENHPLKVKMYVVDQYGRRHKAPKIKLQYNLPGAETY